MPFRDREQAVEVLRLDAEKLQFERTELAARNTPLLLLLASRQSPAESWRAATPACSQ